MVSDLTTFAYRGWKIAVQTKVFFGEFWPQYQDFLVLVLLSASVERCFVSRMRDFFGISATIRIGREMLCLPYVGFVLLPMTTSVYLHNLKLTLVFV